MKKLMIVLIALGTVLVNINFSDAQVVVKVKPVAPVVVRARPAAPHPNWVWVDGYWKWHPRRHEYVWRDGYWIKPRRGYVWVPGYWRDDPGGYIWIEGRWSVR